MSVQLQNRPEISRQYALRAEELKKMVTPYLKQSHSIPTGFSLSEMYETRRSMLLSYFDATLEDWEDWHWQMTHRISDSHVLDTLLPLTAKQRIEIERVGKIFRWGV